MLIINKGSYFLFSGGEVHCSHSGLESHVLMKDFTMNGLMALAQVVQIQKRETGIISSAIYPYFPYARQDRVIETKEPFSLHLFCQFLNTIPLHQVIVYDPHSDVTPALIPNCKVVPQWDIAKYCLPQSFFMDEDTIFVSPDAGAYKKVYKLVSGTKIAIGTKIRSSTGKILSTDVFSPIDISKKRCIIVDDICDGGRTFIELAKVLREKGAKEIYLYVTHGIFSNGLEELFSVIDKIYTTDTIPRTLTHDKLIVKELVYG